MAQYFSDLSPNDFFPLRARNLFDPNAEPDIPYDPVSRMNELYKPREEITNLFLEQLKQIPQREKPGRLRQIGAMLAGLGSGEPAAYWGGVPIGYRANIAEGMKVQDEVLNKPYYEKMRDFALKNKALESGAELEQRGNTNQRILANETVGREIAHKNLEERIRHQSEMEALNKTKSEQIYDVKLQDMQRKVDEAAEKVRVAEANIALKGQTAEATLKFREAQLAAEQAKWNLDRAQRDRQLDEQKRLHDEMKKKWEEENKDRDKRLEQYEKQLGIKTGADKTTTVETKDATGKVKETKTTTTKSGSAPKQEEERVVVYDLKTGKNVATIPKSNVAKLDKTKYGVR